MKFSSPAGALLSVLALILLVPVSAPAADQKAVLVTGANSGIGRNIAERLAREGYFVYAGARRDADIEELSAIENMQGIRLDVTIQEDIDAAVETVRAEDRGLYGVVNNAGVVIMSILAETPEAEMDFVFDVNVYGPYRVVNAFAPLLIESKGRITVNTQSRRSQIPSLRKWER
jgi:NAD(P)-dependent dehydrogenase (short-subunit alcohol dehydrogenase family)